ncbi:spherulation-specific family 4 protein [Streptomyces sp. NA02950]|uniref:spherulation-specific family 4 protein n=1 Tax=Streptomyces sp. NA02950 TaxID=2742137 RepID=UPI0020CAD2EF|nr:spherulation-specific family 4 protein [Streptomyces sp. NA02950]
MLGARTAVLNPGTHPDPGYAVLGDLLVTFGGGWDTCRHTEVPGWTAAHPPERLCQVVYAAPRGRGGRVADTARGRGAAVRCAVPGHGANPWQSAPDGLENAPGHGG